MRSRLQDVDSVEWSNRGKTPRCANKRWKLSGERRMLAGGWSRRLQSWLSHPQSLFLDVSMPSTGIGTGGQFARSWMELEDHSCIRRRLRIGNKPMEEATPCVPTVGGGRMRLQIARTRRGCSRRLVRDLPQCQRHRACPWTVE